MRPGYVYVLQNKAFGANVLKIGLTTRAPDIRAREIYAGATGVPLPFEVAVAFSVTDCVRAEKLIHARLKVYRLNHRREFFRLPIVVGTAVVHEVCAQVNRELGADAPTRLDLSLDTGKTAGGQVKLTDKSPELDDWPIIHMSPELLRPSPIRVPSLSDEQLDRANILFGVLSRVNPVARDRWLDGFGRDELPERELRIWEHMALAYLTLDHADDAPEAYREEAFYLLLQRTWCSTADVLAVAKLRHFSKPNAKRLLNAYALRPKPVIATSGFHRS